MATAIKFTNKNKTAFHREVTRRVEKYFADNHLSKYADGRMVFKTMVMFAIYFVPYGLILSGVLPLWAMWLCSAVMGLGLAGIGMSVMHDANHGAYSSNSTVNKLLGYSLNLIGGDAFNWKVQHNVLHHTYTNIHGHDQDIRPRGNLRLTPAVERNSAHRVQVYYAFILYSLQTLFWVLLKDFMQYRFYLEYNNTEITGAERLRRLAEVLVCKAFYFTYILVIPALLLPITWWQLLIGFVTLHAVGGLVLTTVFQLAHVVEGTEYPEPLNGTIEAEWAIHQMNTTANFAPRNGLVTFFVGGLNYQIEHHLFQRVCHVHYPAIAPIVEQTAREYGVPYLRNDTFGQAVASHVRLLNHLGLHDTLKMATEF
jgi:linoleoyl-CoA desaturase